MPKQMSITMKKDAKYILKNHLSYYDMNSAEGWQKLFRDSIKRCDVELNLSNPKVDYNYVRILQFLARYSIRQIRRINDPEYFQIVKEHLAGYRINQIFQDMFVNENIIKQGLQVWIDYPNAEYKNRWEGLKNVLIDNFTDLELINDDRIYKIYSNALMYAKWQFEKIIEKEYQKLDIWNPIPATDAIEKELNLEDCFIEYYFDKQEKPKYNKKTGKRLPEKDSIKFVMPIGR